MTAAKATDPAGSGTDVSRAELDFETALERLEGLVRELEGGELTLEESLARFEDGVGLVKLCSDRLRAAELRVKQLEAGPDGALEERPLDGEEDS
jgi:exodeoxyribonuclease VII small subunit